MDIKQRYKDFFTRYGQPSDMSDSSICFYLRRPDTLDSTRQLADYDKEAAEYIEKLEQHIEILKMYRQELCKQYNILLTAATVQGVRLEREWDRWKNKVRYRITWYTHYIDSGKDVTDTFKLFPGKERHIAIKEYKEYVKAHPGILADMDIQKAKWER